MATIGSARNPVDEAKLLKLFMELEDLDAKIQSFKAIQTLTIYQKFQRMMLRKKGNEVLQKFVDLRIKKENYAMKHSNLNAFDQEWVNELVWQIETVKACIQYFRRCPNENVEKNIEHVMHIIKKNNLRQNLQILLEDSTDIPEYVQAALA